MLDIFVDVCYNGSIRGNWVAHVKFLRLLAWLFRAPLSTLPDTEGLGLKKILLLVLMALLVFFIFVWLLPPPVVEPSTSMENTTPSIETIVYRIKDQSFETLAAFDVNGQLLFETTDSLNNEVTMSVEQVVEFRERNGALVVHNHPGGTSFSARDLYAEAKRGTKRAIVVTYDHLYILTPGPQGWGDPDALTKAYDEYYAYYAQEAEGLGNRTSSLEKERWTCDQTVNAIARDFGLSYWQIPIKDLFCFHGIQVVTAG